MSVNGNPPIILDPSMDEGHKLNFINDNFRNIADNLNPFQLSDGSNNRLLLGKDSSGNYVVKVSKPGFNAFDTGNANLIFNSNQNMFKIALSGSATVITPATMAAKEVDTATIAHGLGITPAFLAYVNVPNLGAAYVGVNALQNVPFTLFTYNITPLVYVYGAVDNTNLTLNVANLYNAALAGVGATWTFKYYILQETAN